MMKYFAMLALALAVVRPASAAVNEPWTEDDFTEVSAAASPYVAYALRQSEGGVSMLVDVARIGTGGAPKIEVGLAAAKRVILNQANARALPTGDANIVRYAFTIPASALVGQASDWDKLRVGFAVAWPGGLAGEDRQRERFLCSPAGATFDVLSADPQDWQPFDLKEHADNVANSKKRIFVDFNQPLDGKATIVINDAQGHRVRNLMSGQPLTKGPHRIEWDGLDDIGNVAPPGSYSWRAISHPGITPKYLFSFYNQGKPPWRNGTPSSNWLADHSNASAAAAFGDHVYLGAPIAESGQNVVQLNLQGEETNHLNFPTLVGVGKLFLLADATGFYAVMEGNAPYDPYHDLPDGSWELRQPLNVMHWDNNAQLLKYDGPRGEKVVTNNIYHGKGVEKKNAGLPPPNNLGGAAILNGHLYISVRKEKRITILNAATGADEGEIKMDEPGLIAADGKDFLVAFSGKDLVRIDPVSHAVTPLFTPSLSALPQTGDPEVPFYGFLGANPTGIAVSPAHEIFMSDNGADQNVKVFGADGKLLREIGKKGGRPINGTWDGTGMYRPHGIALDQEGKLWVAETDTFPRCNSVWDAKSGALVRDFFGPSYYGADLASFDTADHTRWIGGGAQWKLDFDKKTATPVSTLYHQTTAGELQTRIQGKYWNFYHQDGRTFLIAYGEGQSIYELRADGSLKLWAFYSTLSAIAQMPRWTLPKAITDLPAVQAIFADNIKKNRVLPDDAVIKPFGTWGDMVQLDEHLLGDTSLLWVDRNGDGIAQPEEFEVLPEGDSFRLSSWGVGNPTLDLKIPAMIGGKPVIIPLKPDGFLPSGAPNYSLAKGVASAVPIDPGMVGVEAIQDHSGREIFNSSPMKGVAPDGHTLWSFPNRWVGVHGSHEAPLPETGVMQGTLYFLGTAPLDSDGEVFVMNGNHGRFFVLTTDGMYLDEMFKDVRVAQNADAYLIGGECFGGFFGRAEDGNYYLQSGHTDYRIFQLNGLDKIKRSQGTLEVSAAQMLAAQGNSEAKVAKALEPKFTDIQEAPATTKLSTDPQNWPGLWAIHWGTPQQPFPYAEVKAVRSGDRLYLAYRVKDPSPWVNQGKDWTMLFKTGDSVDFQFSTDPKAKPDRTTPVPGDRRLLIAPFQDQSIAVLYSYREPGATAPMSFASPWRAEKVDKVTELKSAKISVLRGDGTYTLSVSVPLADLGLPAAGQEMELKGDFGVIYGDTAGSMDLLRSYWSNQATGLVNDVPGEIMIEPRMWGTLKFQQQ